jgi:hypothetical protein
MTLLPGPPPSPFAAGVESLAVAALSLSFGYLVADALLGRREVDGVIRWALAFPGLVLYALALMLLHIATGGEVFSNAWLTRGITIIIAAALAVLRLRRRGAGLRAPTADRLALAVVVVLGLVVWASPVLRLLPLVRDGDTGLHAGWAAQLLAGHTTPTSPIIGSVPNDYPWLFHALLALVSRFTPGGRPFHGLAAVQLLQVTGAVSAFFALGRELTRRWTAGAAAALLGAMTGGFGFFALRGLDVVLDPRDLDALRYGGDLFTRRSYNLGFGNLSPPLPRDVTYVLFVAFLLLVVLGLSRAKGEYLFGGGVVLGLIGLTGGEAFFVGGVVAVLVSVLPGSISRARRLLALLAPAVALWSLWVAPLIVNYFKLGGFRNLASRPVQLPVQDILVTWGIVTPLAVVGAALWLPRIRRSVGVQVALSVVAATALLLSSSSLIPKVLGEGFVTLGRAHRYWPFLFLGLALFGAYGLSELVERAGRTRRWLATPTAAAALLLALPSPIVASLALPEKLPRNPSLTAALEGEPRTILNQVSRYPGDQRVVAAVPEEEKVIFGYGASRMLVFKWARQFDGHVRWTSIATDVAEDPDRISANMALVSGRVSPSLWLRLADRYGIEAVVAASDHADAPAFRACRVQRDPTDGRFILVEVETCRIPPAAAGGG